MGTYLATGIVQNIVIDKEDMERPIITVDKIALKLREEINLDHYSYVEKVDSHSWEIKPKMLEGNFVEFLDTQFQMYKNPKDKYMQEVIDEISKAKTGEQILQIAADKEFASFQLINNLIDYIYMRSDSGFQLNIPVNYHMIAFFLDGKILMECYGSILEYLAKNIHLQKTKYQIADCIKIMITR